MARHQYILYVYMINAYRCPVVIVSIDICVFSLKIVRIKRIPIYKFFSSSYQIKEIVATVQVSRMILSKEDVNIDKNKWKCVNLCINSDIVLSLLSHDSKWTNLSIYIYISSIQNNRHHAPMSYDRNTVNNGDDLNNKFLRVDFLIK